MAKLITVIGKALQGQDQSSGTVSRVVGNTVSVTTSTGVREYIYSGTSRIQAGDRVSLNGGNVIGVMRPDDSIPIFYM